MNTGSGSGGFYKYRCKYFYSHNCTNWVYVSNAPCASCLAEGRDSTDAPAQPYRRPKEIRVPYWNNGVLQYSIMEIVHTDQSGLYWEVRHKVASPRMNAAAPTTSDQPRAMYVTSRMPQGPA